MGKLNNLVYDIVGAGDFESEIKQMTHSLGLDSTVVFHGAVDAQKLALLYSQADLFVMPVVDDPFDKEGFGLSYLEAASYGVPSIATDIPGVDEAVLQGETGVLIPDNDIGQLVGWMMKLLTDDSSRSRMGKNARERVECEFTCERQFSKLEPYL
jgi:phosphatidyl-myo-inositol dimannoside synthase